MLDATSSAASSSGQSHPDTLRAPPAATTAPGDSCMWYTGVSCFRPRSCFDCLNVALANGSACAIDPYGVCVPLSAYSYTDDYRRHRQSELQSAYPSTNTTYCSTTEPGCADCRRQPFFRLDGLYGFADASSVKAQCIGANGCVCVAACETPDWRTNVLAKAQCPTLPPDGAMPPSLFAFRTTGIAYVLMGVSFAGFFVLLILVRRWWMSQRGREIRRARFAQLRLTLEGWNALRQKLIDEEHAEMGLKPKLRLQRDGDNSDAEHAIGEHQDDSAELVIESGDGYRPVSPSEYEHHRHQHTREEEPHAPAA